MELLQAIGVSAVIVLLDQKHTRTISGFLERYSVLQLSMPASLFQVKIQVLHSSMMTTFFQSKVQATLFHFLRFRKSAPCAWACLHVDWFNMSRRWVEVLQQAWCIGWASEMSCWENGGVRYDSALRDHHRWRKIVDWCIGWIGGWFNHYLEWVSWRTDASIGVSILDDWCIDWVDGWIDHRLQGIVVWWTVRDESSANPPGAYSRIAQRSVNKQSVARLSAFSVSAQVERSESSGTHDSVNTMPCIALRGSIGLPLTLTVRRISCTVVTEQLLLWE